MDRIDDVIKCLVDCLNSLALDALRPFGCFHHPLSTDA